MLQASGSPPNVSSSEAPNIQGLFACADLVCHHTWSDFGDKEKLEHKQCFFEKDDGKKAKCTSTNFGWPSELFIFFIVYSKSNFTSDFQMVHSDQ